MLDLLSALEMVAVVDDGPSALSVIRSWRPEIIILDARLLNDSAAQFVCTAKLEGKATHLIVVADRLAQFEPLLEAGADKVLLKGFSAAELSSAIGQLVPGSPDRSALSGEGREGEES
jgi:DNA-binding response OmpR family regulator